MPGFIFHSLRRTAVRNMVDAGVPEKRAMEISGHVTRSVFDRYNVGSQRDSDASVDQIEQFQKVTTEKVHTYNMHTEPSVGQVPFDKSLN